MFERRHLFPPDARYPGVHAASVAVLPGGALIASWFGGSREGAPDAAIWGAAYRDGRWSEPRVLADTPGQADGNSVLWLDGAGVLRLWYVTMEGRGWATCPVRERRSPDGGVTWGEPRYIREEWGWMVRNEPIRHNGRIVMPMYDERDWSAFLLLSDDGGDTWTRSDSLRADVGIIQPAVAPLPDGRLLMLLRSSGGAVYRSRSLDRAGRAWEAPAPSGLPNPNSAVELIRLRSEALLLLYNPTARGRSPLRVALSDDGGASWPDWRDLETGEGEFSYPTAVQAPDGLVHALYTYRRRTIAHATFDEAWMRAGA